MVMDMTLLDTQQSFWHHGFLANPHPLVALDDTPIPRGIATALDEACHALPAWNEQGIVQQRLAELPELDVIAILPELDAHLNATNIRERLFVLYGFMASAYCLTAPYPKQLPMNLARPFASIADVLQRPPMLSYSALVLHNWQRIDPTQPIALDNLIIPHTLTSLPDERHFYAVHVAIEASAAPLLQALWEGNEAARHRDSAQALEACRTMREALVMMTRIFHQMPEGCDPDRYFQQVRPYLFGLSDIVFEGVSDMPQSFRGGSGAQSSIVPATLAALGVQHEHNELTHHLTTMRDYMPHAHRDFIRAVASADLRDFARDYAPLRDAYNHVLRALMTFRRAHLYYARAYIFAKSTHAIGTGGTDSMHFLSKLIDETNAQML